MNRKSLKGIVIALLAINLCGWLALLAIQSRKTRAPGSASPGDQDGRTNGAAAVSVPLPPPEDVKRPAKPSKDSKKAPEKLPKLRFCGFRAMSPAFSRPIVSLGFSDQVGDKDAGKLISCFPPVPFGVSTEVCLPCDDYFIPGSFYMRLALTGDFVPGKTYTFRISGNLKSLKNQPLEEGKSFEVKIPDRQPGLRFLAGSGRYLAPHGDMTIPFQSVNATNAVIVAERILPQNLHQFVMRDLGHYDNWFGGSDEENVAELVRLAGKKNFPIHSPTNEIVHVGCDLSDVIGKNGYGAYYIRMMQGGGRPIASKIVCVSDLGIFAKKAGGTTTVLVTSLTTAKPVPDVKISVVSKCNFIIGTAVTDASGLACVPSPEKETPLSVVAENPANGDASYLLMITGYSRSSWAGAPYVETNKCEGFVYTDRGVYRPGEKVFCESILRNWKQVAPVPFPVVFKLFGTRGNLLRTIPAMPDSLGAVRTTIAIPEEYLLGAYRVEVCTPGEKGGKLGEASFLVESIVPPQIRVDIPRLPDRFDASTNETFLTEVSSAYLFGSPAAGLKASAQMDFQPVAFTSPKWDDYLFGDPGERKNKIPVQKLSGLKLDGNGHARLAFSLKDLRKIHSPVKACVLATVLEDGGRPCSEAASTIIDTRPWYIGISGPRSFPSDSSASFNWALVRPDGALFTNGTPLTASLDLEEEDWFCRMEDGDRLVWKFEKRKTVVFSGEKVPAGHAGQGRYSFAAPDPSWGTYLLTLSDKEGNRSTFPFRVPYSGNDVGSAPSASASVEMKPDRESYRPGDTATIHLSAPFTGTLWLVVRDEKVLQSRVVPLTQKELDIQVPVQECLAPGVKVAAMVVRPVVPEEIWSPHRAMGLAYLSVRPQQRILDVSVNAPANVIPSSRLSVDVGVTNRASGPVSDGTVTVMAVDEALCRLTGFVTPSPVGFFFRQRTGFILHYDFFSDLMQVTDQSLVGFLSHTGGDEAANSPKVRLNPIKTRRFKPLALVKAGVPVRDGKATAVFDLPEFTGRLRVMAVACTGSAAGSSEARTSVRREIVVRPDMARCLAPGDSSELTIALHNLSSKDVPVDIVVRGEGPLEIPERPDDFVLPAKGSRTLVVPVRAMDSVGAAKVVLVVSAAGDKYEQSVEIPVRPSSAWETGNTSLTVGPGESALFEPAGDILPSTFEQELEFSAFPVADARSALDYLLEYSFGCLEQTVSRAYPFLELAKLPPGIVPDAKDYDPAVRVKAAVGRIALMRRGDTGFSMWPDYLPANCRMSLYAIQFLAEAIRAGYDTGEMTPGYLADMTTSIADREQFDESEIALCYALLGRPQEALMARLNDRADLGVEQLARLARAYFVSGNPVAGRKALERAGSPVSLASAALLLAAWTEIDPMSPCCAECIQRINSEKSAYYGHWETTCRNALVAKATLSSLAATGVLGTNQTIRFKLEFEENGKKETVVFPGTNSHFSVTGKGNGPVVVFNTGTNSLCVRRTVTAVPLATNRPPVQSQMAVSRNYYTTEGDALDLSKVKRGDNVVVELVAVPSNDADDIIIEDLLPACLEVERENVGALNAFPWIQYDGPGAMHAEARDDRVLVFPERVPRLKAFKWYYLARVVSAGEYVVPAVRASEMYNPHAFSRGSEGKMTVFR